MATAVEGGERFEQNSLRSGVEGEVVSTARAVSTSYSSSLVQTVVRERDAAQRESRGADTRGLTLVLTIV